MTIGGEINPIMGWDIGNNLYKQDGAGISFVTSAIPVPAVKGHRGDYYINPINGIPRPPGGGASPTRSTDYRLCESRHKRHKLSARAPKGICVVATLHRRHEAHTLPGRLRLPAPTIDPEGPSGCVSTVAYEIGYTSKSYGGFRFAIAADMPSYYSLERLLSRQRLSHVRRQAGAQRRRRRDGARLPAWIEYSHSQWNRVRLSGILRHYAYRDLVAGKRRGVMGWASCSRATCSH